MSREKNQKNDEYVILKRRQEAARLYMEGHTQIAIAEKLGVNQSCVSKDLDVIRKGWEASAILDWDAAKTSELAALDLQLAELWEAWRLSLSLEQVRTKNVKREVRDVTEGKGKDKKVVGSKMTPTEVTSKKVEKQLIGDPRIMAEITKIRELRCKILGFLKDEKPNQTNTLNINIDWDAISRPIGDEIEERLALEKAKVVQVKQE